MAGDEGVEPPQTGSQSPARCHYANPLYYKTQNFNASPIKLFIKLMADKIGLEPIIVEFYSFAVWVFVLFIRATHLQKTIADSDHMFFHQSVWR